MKWLRYESAEGPRYGLLAGTTIADVEGTPFSAWRATGRETPLAEARLLAPVVPRRVFGAGLNYVAHIREVGASTPAFPMLFMKPDSAVIGPGAPIVYPREAREVHYEAELAVVIGRSARRVSEADAHSVVLGYTCANDVSERVIQRAEMAMGTLLVGKGYDGFCPLGPVVDTDVDPSDLAIRAIVNGTVRQDSRTSDLLFGVEALVAYLSRAITLQPGDVIITGTPAGVGPIVPGDVVDIAIEGLGTLSNPVVAEPTG